MFGLVLIIVVSQHHTSGQISTLISALWICVAFPKNIYYYYQSWWTDNDVLHISPHWNWRDKRNQPIDVWVNTNADDVELFLNGKV
jgi:beta-galactosidase